MNSPFHTLEIPPEGLREAIEHIPDCSLIYGPKGPRIFARVDTLILALLAQVHGFVLAHKSSEIVIYEREAK